MSTLISWVRFHTLATAESCVRTQPLLPVSPGHQAPVFPALDPAAGANGTFSGNSSSTMPSLENPEVSFNDGRIRPQS